MIVWGGLIGGVGTSLNTGGRYDPLTDGWTATATGVNVPAARASNTTVWTGAELIVWGGQDADSLPVNTGGRYDPSTDSWAATSTGASAPSARRGHSAVWTGGQMIVWAGAPTNNNLDLYCGCTQKTFYRDADADTYGNPGVTLSACDGSLQSGYVLDNSDCNDSDASIHPGAAETCNGLDDDCDLAVDNGGASSCDDSNACTDDACSNGACSWTPGSAPSEVSSMSASKAGATVTFDWSASVGAITYDMLRGRARDWPVGSNPATETCFDDVVVTSASDATLPPVDDGYWYLVRGENACGNGGYGSQASHGVPTVPRLSGTCP